MSGETPSRQLPKSDEHTAWSEHFQQVADWEAARKQGGISYTDSYGRNRTYVPVDGARKSGKFSTR